HRRRHARSRAASRIAAGNRRTGVRGVTMTAASEQCMAYHIGIVVHDLYAVAHRYDELFGPLHWHTWEAPVGALPWNPETTDGRLRIAYGRLPGLTLELVQPLSGETVHGLFLKRRGECVQHIGLWVPDVREAL